MSNVVDRNYSLLVATANSADCRRIKVALEAYGHNVAECGDGNAAWGTLVAQDFDLAIIDLDLPGQNGLELMSRMCRQEVMPRLQTVVLGEADNEDLCDLAFGLGAAFYIPKPVLMPLLTHSVWHVLRCQTRDREMRWLKDRLGIKAERKLELAV